MQAANASEDPLRELPLERWAWALPVAIVPFLLSIPALFGEVFLYRDILGLVIPQQAFRAAAFAQGRLPEWNPLSYGGTPFLADPGTGVFYPGNFLFSLLEPATAATWFVLLHLALAGGATYALIRHHRGSRAISAIGGSVYATSGYLLSMHGMHYACSSAALLPLAVVMLLRASDRSTSARLVLAASTWALLFFNGEWQVTIFAGGLAAGLVLVEAQARLRRLGALVAAIALGTALAAIQVIPSLLFAQDSVRAHGFSLADASSWALHPARWIEFLIPSPFGLPYSDNHFFGTALLDPGHTSAWAAGLSLVGGFAAVALLVPWRRANRRTLAWAAMGAVALLLAAGPHTPIFAAWIRFVPLADRFRYPEKFAVVTTLALVVLASMAVESIRTTTSLRHRWLWISVALCGAAALVAAVAPAALLLFIRDGLARASANIDVEGARAELVRACLHATLACAGTAFALELLARRRRAGLALLALVVVADGALTGTRLLSYGNGEFLREKPALLERVLASRPPGTAGRTFREHCPFPGRGPGATLLERVRQWEWASGKSNFLTLAGVPDAVGYGPAESAEKRRVFKALAPVAPERLLELLGVTARIACDARGSIQTSPLPSPLARIAIVSSELVSDSDLLTGLAAPATDLSRQAFVTDPGFTTKAAPGARATLVEELPERLRIHTEGAGLLVVMDSFAAGWRARIDGVPAPITRANALWRGVVLPSGSHEVVFDFTAPGLIAGALTSSLALALCALLLLASRRRAKPPLA